MKFRRLVGAALAAATVSAVMAATPVNAAVGDINVIVGNGSSGYTGDGGLASSAQLTYPYSLDTDSSGNLYIADDGNHVIRKIDHATGFITTVAGNGTSGYTGDGGLATAAQFKDPCDVAVDSSGNLYIVDASNHVVRKVDHATGFITTVVGTGTNGYTGDGGLATAAQLDDPSSVTLDSSGNLYIADYTNHVVRKVDHATGFITTVAGNGTDGYSGDSGPATSAQLKGPTDVAVDADGRLYISDYTGNAIRMVVGGIITTYAGTGTPGFSGDGFSANLGQLHYPSYLALDSDKNLYIADFYNSVIRKVAFSTGAITTVAGTGTNGFSGSGGPALNAQLHGSYGLALHNNTLYIGDYYNHAIWAMTIEATILPPTGAGTDTMVWIATALFAAGAVLVVTRRRLAR